MLCRCGRGQPVMPDGKQRAVLLRLYVAGEGHRSSQARRAAAWLAERIRDCDVEIVDVMTEPAKAEEARVIATPTLVRLHPQPVLRVIGGLDDVEQIARLLQLELGEQRA